MSTSTTAERLLPNANPALMEKHTQFFVGLLKSSSCMLVLVGMATLGWVKLSFGEWIFAHFPPTVETKFDLAGKSIYFIVTDRFARSGAAALDDTFCNFDVSHEWTNNGVDFRGINVGPRAPTGGRCGGTFRGILDKLSYIKGMGFDCIWISPVVRSSDYTGYAAEDFFLIDHHVGTPEELKELADTLHAHDMCLIIDVVLNHVRQMSYLRTDSADPQAHTVYMGPESVHPFNDESYYHTYLHGKKFEQFVVDGPPQVADSFGNNSVLKHHWEKGLVQCGPEHFELTTCICFPGNSGPHCPGSNHSLQINGWFASLADLNQSVPFVREQLLAYLNWLMDEFGNDAFRLDTAIYMPPDFLAELQEKVKIAIMGEATVNNLTYHASYQNNVLSSLLNFPVFYHVPRAFCQMHMFGDFGNYSLQGVFTSEAPNLTRLAAVLKTQQQSGLYSNLDLLGNFVDNHDEFARIGHYCKGDESRIKNALAWVMLSRGMPIIYYGTEQGLIGHQQSAEETAYHPDPSWVQLSSQARLRESLWHTHYNTSTWQYKFIAVLNKVRKKNKFTVGQQRLIFSNESAMIFTRTTTDSSTVWVFINNVENVDALKPLVYCPGPPLSTPARGWVDAISGGLVDLRHGCFVANDAYPKVLVEVDRDRD